MDDRREGGRGESWREAIRRHRSRAGQRPWWLCPNFARGGGGEEGDILDPFQDPLMNWGVEVGGERRGDILEEAPGDCVLSRKCASDSERGKPELREEPISGSTIGGSALDTLGQKCQLLSN